VGSSVLRATFARLLHDAARVIAPSHDVAQWYRRVWPELALHPDLMLGKRLLSGTLERPLPDSVVRHPKQGFTLPFGRWMAGELGPFVQDGMRRLSDAGWITPEAPDRVWADWRSGAAHWSRPWGLSVLGHFLNQ